MQPEAAERARPCAVRLPTFALVLCVTGVACSSAPPPEQDAVFAAFDRYRTAVLDKDGDAAADAVTGSTFEAYES